MAIGTTKKDPNSTRKYTVDWTRFLAKCAEVAQDISASDWTVPTGLELIDEDFTSKKTVIWLRGGTLGARYDVINRITAGDGQIQDATIEVIIEEQ
jgi:hypothetical protein